MNQNPRPRDTRNCDTLFYAVLFAHCTGRGDGMQALRGLHPTACSRAGFAELDFGLRLGFIWQGCTYLTTGRTF